MLSARWIWKGEASGYNQAVVFVKNFEAEIITQALLKVSADSWYRLWVNGVWVNDGPCRSWPEHYQYDEIEIAPYLHPGQNELRILVRYWGTGTFHTCPQQGGLLAQVELKQLSGNKITIRTDESWLVSEFPAFRWNTPKVSIQMEPQEYYDARLADSLEFNQAVCLFAAGEGPWLDLQPRDVPLLTRQPVAFKSYLGASLLRRIPDWHYCLPSARLNYPHLVEANRNVSQPGGVCTVMKLEKKATVRFQEDGMQVFIDGYHNPQGKYRLDPGKHVVLVLVTEVLGHNKEKSFRLEHPPAGLRLENPLDSPYPNPWCWLEFPGFRFAQTDLRWPDHGLEDPYAQKIKDYAQFVSKLGASVIELESFTKHLAQQAVNLPESDLFALDTHWRFIHRRVKGDASERINYPSGLMFDNPTLTTVSPSSKGDIELCYDLGQQVVGYYDFELVAEAGVEVDIYSVEYLTPEGIIQHTTGNRNGMTYITKAGTNRFTSTKRRSGRYVFITFHHQTRPINLRKFQVIESTYPVDTIGSFSCSDARLDRIFEISARTLTLCMEDTFTDCPLYEQTLWVGDARNEAIFAYDLFGAADIGKRCIQLAAQSLDRYVITGCQVPSGWDCLLPAWSFLWGIAVWDYYTFTADRAFLEEIWPVVIKNLEGAFSLLDSHGLFSGPFWNMFDWSGIDDCHETVLHNSMLLVGAIDAALGCAMVLDDHDGQVWLETLRGDLVRNLNCWWSKATKSYPDSLSADGSPSLSVSQHTSFLALLYGIASSENKADVLDNMLTPPQDMVRVGSPFAMMYYYEALEKAGYLDNIIASIYEAYLPMLEAGATTVWETFPSSNVRPGQFPTRSHCHAWSSAPIHFLPRLILGIQATAPGGQSFTVSPRISGLSWAKGRLATARGTLEVEWKIDNSQLRVRIKAPEGTRVQFVENETHQGLEIVHEP